MRTPPPKIQSNDTPHQCEIVAYEPEDPLLKEDFNEELNFDVQAFLQDIEEENMSLTQVDTTKSTSMTVQRQTVKRSPKIPIFSGCKIGTINNLHIHVHKN